MKALIVVDAQNDFVTGPLGTKEAQAAIPNIKKLIKDMTDEDGDTIIIATQDTHYERNYPDTLEGKKLPVFHCGYNTRGWEIVKEVADMIEPTTHCTIFKNTFGTEDIGDMVLDHIYPNPLEEIHICGFCTEICVAANAIILRAQFPNTPIYIHADACAGVTPESHNAALTVFAAQQMEVVR